MTLLETATDWSAIWSITFVSFGLVILILLLLVYVMKIFGLFFKEKKTNPKAQETATTAKKAENVSDETEVVAAIGVAIALAQGALHIEEPGYLTFGENRQTAWNNKAYGLRQMPERIK